MLNLKLGYHCSSKGAWYNSTTARDVYQWYITVNPSGCVISLLIPQSHPITGPARFSTRTIFDRKVQWSARRNFTPLLFSWSHQATGPVRLDTSVHLWFDRIIRRTPHALRAMPVRASHGPRTGITNVFHIQRTPCGTRKGAVRHPYVTDRTEFAKISHGRRIWPEGAHTRPFAVRTVCSRAIYDLQTRTGPVSL